MIPSLLQFGLLGALIGAAVLVTVAVILIRWAWNSTVTDIFGVRRVTLWEAFKLLLLATLLFGGSITPLIYVVSETTTTKGATKTVTYGIGTRTK